MLEANWERWREVRWEERTLASVSEALSCTSAFALTSSVLLGRLLNISGPLAGLPVREQGQVIQDVQFCPDSL
jgi:hypothetical protein